MAEAGPEEERRAAPAGDSCQLDFDAICENDDIALASLMNYLEAEGRVGDPTELSDIQWTH